MNFDPLGIIMAIFVLSFPALVLVALVGDIVVEREKAKRG